MFGALWLALSLRQRTIAEFLAFGPTFLFGDENRSGILDTKILGVPLVELDAGQFSLPIATYATSYFLTARMAARRMLANKSGVS